MYGYIRLEMSLIVTKLGAVNDPYVLIENDNIWKSSTTYVIDIDITGYDTLLSSMLGEFSSMKSSLSSPVYHWNNVVGSFVS
jgi:hypothetical protein